MKHPNKPNLDEPFHKPLETLARSKGSIVQVFSDFVKIAACTVACETREDEYCATIKNYQKEELEYFTQAFASMISQMEAKPFSDILGVYYQDIASKFTRDSRGEFYTPEHMSELMARISVDVETVIKEGVPITVSEPTCGGGGMILQLAKLFSPEERNDGKSYVDLMRVTAQDVSPIACHMTFINTTLWGIPAKVIQGDSLAMTIENQWKNIHWFRVQEDERLAMRDMINVLKAPPPSSAEAPESPPVSTVPSVDLGEMRQVDFDF